jgi:uncharacterized membrane protein YjdF
MYQKERFNMKNMIYSLTFIFIVITVFISQYLFDMGLVDNHLDFTIIGLIGGLLAGGLRD